jgi:hypothetical protein
VKHLLEPILLLEKIVGSGSVRHKLTGKRERWCKRDHPGGFGHIPAALHDTRRRNRRGEIGDGGRCRAQYISEISYASHSYCKYTAAGLCRACNALKPWRIWWRCLEQPSHRLRLRRLSAAHSPILVETRYHCHPDSSFARSNYASCRPRIRTVAASSSRRGSSASDLPA